MSKNILLVDDDPDLIEILRYELYAANYRVETASNGAVALKILENFQPNLIISDVTMPVMDGVDFFEALKKNPRTEKVPVLILTGSQNLEKYFRILKIGDFVSKPFDMEILMCKVKNLIDYDERLRAIREGKSRAKVKIEDADNVIYVKTQNRTREAWSIVILCLLLVALVLTLIGPKMISAAVEFIGATIQ